MWRIKAYTNIWRVEKVFYKINDFKLPRPITFSQGMWFLGGFLFMLFFGKIPPLNLIDNFFIKNLGIPILLAIVMSKKTFDGKKPYSFLISFIRFIVSPKKRSRDKTKKLENVVIDSDITMVRSVRK
jgi:hypothetical protein